MIELDWLGRLYEIGDVLRMTVKGKCIDGYLREVMSYNELTMYLNMERQLEVIHTIPVEQRLLFCDSTGGLVSLPQEARKFKRVLNYDNVVYYDNVEL